MYDKYIKIEYENIDDRYSCVKYCFFDLIIDNTNGYINADKLCLTFNKNFSQWLKNEENKELVECVQRENSDLVIVKNNSYGQTRGNYVHPDLMKYVGVWIDVETSYAIMDVIIDFLKRKNKKDVQKMNVLIDQKQQKIEVLKELVLTIIERKREFVNKQENVNDNFDRKNWIFYWIIYGIILFCGWYCKNLFLYKKHQLYIA
jgi:hypothetical protein